MAGAFALRLVPRLAAAPPGRGKGGGRAASGRALVSKKPNKEHHLWIRKETAGSGKKALRLVDTVSKLPNEREAIYGALDKWSAFEPEFPIIAAAKALGMLKRRRQWLRIIQVTKWLMSKGQVLTWTTYDTLLLALFMDGRVDEAESIWNTIIQTHTRSVPKRLRRTLLFGPLTVVECVAHSSYRFSSIPAAFVDC
ncbi:pentatricopeptide repeat-containing protein At4g18975, chloroplastic-like isoform X2 [Phragmites australis]|uniref:pentatricopeptide repeat-containing protein At4g18975, chloroplastic-like isoform X2 n=1 Tax=Phragmites australis TaxID=29695 RepID=UPI002D792A06|nr:pentatricopeptide repeat-containing protein At4g18975, chloroplastic-like isoform X2 [Phragmites australis]